jgi:hypothetical protein
MTNELFALLVCMLVGDIFISSLEENAAWVVVKAYVWNIFVIYAFYVVHHSLPLLNKF